MSEGQRPNLSLEPSSARRGPAPRERSPMERMLWFLAAMSSVTVLIMAMMFIVVLLGMNRNIHPGGLADGTALRQAAMELEEKGLSLQSAEGWLDYLNRAGAVEDRAEILYRAGKLYMQAEKYGDAAACFVRAEAEADAAADETLSEKIGPKLVECLERMGRPGEADRELSRRVEVGAENKTGAILATVAGEEIRESDIERMSRRYADRFLSSQGLPPNSPAREDIRQRLASPAMQARILQETVQMELLARHARELGLHEDPEYVETMRQATEGLLQEFLLKREFAAIEPSPSDVENYFQANQDRYGKPETAEVLLVQFEPDEDVQAVLDKIKTADDFRAWFEERQKANAQSAGKTTLRKSAEMPPELAAVFDLAEGEWTKSPVPLGPGKLLLLVEKKETAAPATFAEAEQAVRRDYVAQKQQEKLGRLMEELMKKYDVRILAPRVSDGFAMPTALPAEQDAATIPALNPVAPDSVPTPPGLPAEQAVPATATDASAEQAVPGEPAAEEPKEEPKPAKEGPESSAEPPQENES